MLAELKNSLVALLLLTVALGIVYPAAVTAIAQIAFHDRANGSLLPAGRGSSLIGQQFDDPKYFWGRLSATGPVPYTAFNAQSLTGSSGSNYAMSNPAAVEAARARIAALKAADPDSSAAIPVDLVTASGSGLDPHISPAAAEFQVPRVSRIRGIDEEPVRRLVRECTESSAGGVLGPASVNVLRLNLALDGQVSGAHPHHETISQDVVGWRGRAFLVRN